MGIVFSYIAAKRPTGQFILNNKIYFKICAGFKNKLQILKKNETWSHSKTKTIMFNNTAIVEDQNYYKVPLIQSTRKLITFPK